MTGSIRRLGKAAAPACAAIHRISFPHHPWPDTELAALLDAPEVHGHGIFSSGEPTPELEHNTRKGTTFGPGIMHQNNEIEAFSDWAQYENALGGFILSRIAADEAEILTVAVPPALRGHGLGRAMLAHHAEALVRAGIARLFLEVDVDNAPARALYARQGFARVGERKAYYRKADGSTATALILRKDLPI